MRSEISIKSKILFLFLLLFVSCTHNRVIFLDNELTIFSERPDIFSCGTKIIDNQTGYGVVSYQNGGTVTYPVLLLSNNDPLYNDCEIFFQGVDINIDRSKERAYLELYVNYVEKSLQNLTIDIIALKKKLDNQPITYNKIHTTEMLDRKNTKRFYFNLEKSDDLFVIKELPIDKRGVKLSFDITEIVHNLGNGFIMSVPHIFSDDYATTDNNNIISGSATIEFASSAWESWEGGANSNTGETNWIKIKNNGYKNKKYSPAIVITSKALIKIK